MASRKLARDILLARQCHSRLLLHPQQVVGGRSGLVRDRRVLGSRGMSIFGEFRKQVKGEAKSNTEFQQSVEELNKKVGGIKEELESKAKQTKDKIYKQVDGIWTEAESTTKKVSATVIEKISAAKEEVKGSLGLGEKESSGSSGSSSASAARVGGESTASYEEEKFKNAESTKTNETDWQSDTLYGKLKSTAAAFYPKVSLSFGGFKEARVLDLVKKGYNFVKDELNSTPAKRKKMQYASSSVPEEQRSTKTDMVVVPSKQSRLGKKWEALKEKMRGHPVFKRATGISEPVITKSHELAEDMRERWETSDHPVVHKIQDLNETVFGETATALSFKEIRRRDPSFSLPDFVAEVQEMIKPTLTAYLKCDVETLKKYCSPEVIERCKGERTAYESQGYFFENKILHISDVEVRETKMMGSSPIIILAFQTQQIYCIRDRQGSVTAGGKDSIQTVYYAWAMQLFDAEELGETSIFPTWRLREMQQIGVQALI